MSGGYGVSQVSVSMPAPGMHTKKPFQRGMTPSSEIFNEPELSDDLYVLQVHTYYVIQNTL